MKHTRGKQMDLVSYLWSGFGGRTGRGGITGMASQIPNTPINGKD